MNGARLSRQAAGAPPPAPVRVVHLGLGSFFRAHQAWYTEHAPEASDWGFAAFTGRSTRLSDALTAQGGLYTLVTRAADGDRFELVCSLSRAHPAADHARWLAYFAEAALAVVTITVTEAGYVRGAQGGLDASLPEVRADLDALRHDPTSLAHTAPGRLVAALAARRRACAGPLTLVPCDNLAANGAVVERVLRDFAELVDPTLAAWIEETVSTVSTVADRITPRTAAEDVQRVLDATGMVDRVPVVTEPFTEWILSGEFVAGRPRWDAAGAQFVDDLTPFEHRKLWLLNGAHSLLAYAGSIRGHATVAEAIDDAVCRSWVEDWWNDAAAHLRHFGLDSAAYRDALVDRFANRRIRHALDQIAADGSQKLPIRILPVLRAELASGRTPSGGSRVLAAWICHLRGLGAPVRDVQAGHARLLAGGPLPRAVCRVLGALDPVLVDDHELVATVTAQCEELACSRRSGSPTRGATAAGHWRPGALSNRRGLRPEA